MNAASTSTPTTGTIGAALARLRVARRRRPGFGHSVGRSESVLVGPLRCETRDGEALIATDLPAALGGDASAPTPTVLVRAALGSCLAMGYRLRAAELGVELTDVKVTVESESELVGMLDPCAGAPPGFTALRYRVEIDSPAPAADVERVVELADRLSPVLDMLRRPAVIERTVATRQAEA